MPGCAGAPLTGQVCRALFLTVAGSADTTAQRSLPADIITRLHDPRPLAEEEIADVLQAACEAMAYKTRRLSSSPTTNRASNT